MRVQVNLASRPFVELRPFFLRLRLIMGALALAGVAVAAGAHVLSVRAEKQQIELDHLRDQTIATQQVKLRTEQRMRQPVNAQVLDRAHFLNALFLRKSFSWTAVMMDLENVLPAGVQVTSIEPQIAPTGNVVIRLRVAGQRANAVQLVRNLERSHRFLQARLASESSQLKENGAANGTRPPVAATQGPTPPSGVEFDILADYNPLPPGEPFGVTHVRPAAVRVVPVASHAGGITPGANVRNGYPRDGVRLTPYRGPGSGAAGPNTSQGVPR